MTPELVLAWQRKLTKEGLGQDRRRARGLSANTVRLARAPLAGAFKLAVGAGMVAVSPMGAAPRPRAARSVPRHWTPEQARKFLALMEGDRTWPAGRSCSAPACASASSSACAGPTSTSTVAPCAVRRIRVHARLRPGAVLGQEP